MRLKVVFFFYLHSFFIIGSIILALHDTSDVFLEAAKVFKYSNNEFGASVFFGLFAISWLVLRLIFFPFWVIKATRFVCMVYHLSSFNSSVLLFFCTNTHFGLAFFSYDLQNYLNLEEGYPRFIYYGFNTMLLMLLVFHIYWWILICSMIRRQLKNRGQVGEDIRSGQPK